MSQYTVDPSIDLEGEVDVEAVLAAFPQTSTIKGLFFPRLVTMLGDSFWSLRRKLRRWPDGGHYRAREDYPHADYARLAFAAAERYFPHVSPLEGVRRVARQDYHVFARTAIGRAFLAVLGDVSSTFLNYPVIHPMLVTGVTTVVRPIEGGMRVEHSGYVGTSAYALGTFEGFVLAFGLRPTITVSLPSDTFTAFDVRWR